MSSKLKVFASDGETFLRWVDELEAWAMIRARLADGLGNKRRFYALKMRAKAESYKHELLKDFRHEHLRHAPVVAFMEVLAPSPRRHFWSDKSVWKQKQGRTRGEEQFMRDVEKQAKAAR